MRTNARVRISPTRQAELRAEQAARAARSRQETGRVLQEARRPKVATAPPRRVLDDAEADYWQGVYEIVLDKFPGCPPPDGLTL